jgi:hypothetical protein
VASTAVSWPGRLRQIRSFFRARSPEQMLATAAPWHVGPNLIRMPPINTLDPGDLALSNSITLVAIAPMRLIQHPDLLCEVYSLRQRACTKDGLFPKGLGLPHTILQKQAIECIIPPGSPATR